MTNSHRPILMALTAVVLAASPLHAATRHVALNGIDSGTCGATAATPCRSISKAIALATAGDTVLVGPGTYGDLNTNGDCTDPGDEISSAAACLVEVDKPLRVVSSNGAHATLIREATSSPGFVVRISSSGVEFGGANKGFTIVGKASVPSFGIQIDPGMSGVEVTGNVLEWLAGGILVFGSDAVLKQNRTTLNGGGLGYLIGGTGAELNGNVAANSSVGVDGGGTDAVLSRNVVVANLTAGMSLSGTAIVTMNALVGNGLSGADLGPVAPTLVALNSIYGNGETFDNCGVRNVTGGAVAAAANYWGAPSGPGPNPADAIGGVCDVGGGSTTSAPAPRAKEIKVAVKALR